MSTLTASSAIATGRVQLANVRQNSLLTAKVRILVIVGLILFVAFVAIARIVQLGIAEQAPEGRSMAQRLLPPRGEITDRNGEPLARAFPAYALWFNPKAFNDDGRNPLVKTPQEVAAALVKIFPDADYDELVKRLKQDKASYLVRRVLPEQANRVHALGEPALEIPRENQRYYPQGSLAAHVLGYVATDGHGRVGMEQVLDKRLLDPATRGKPVELSIDVRVQSALEDELNREIGLTNAKGGTGIVLDVDSGEVLALASLPEFDPNRTDQAYNHLVYNRATNQVYELGSVMKPLTVAAAIDAGTITDLSRRYKAGAPLEIAGFKIHDDHNYGATLNIPEALVHSSNIVLAQVGDELGAHRLRETMLSLGFKERPFIELPARGKPLWPRLEDHGEWSRITTMTVSYGHGIAITPLHLACAYAALVNGGIWHPATLMKEKPGAKVEGRRVFTASTSARMRQLLRMIVKVGTGRKANADGFRIGGKTGTAELAGEHGYRKNAVIATFASAFPMDKPRYVVIATLDEPQGTQATSFQRTAAWNAAPVVGRLVPRIGPMLGIMPDPTRDVDISDIAPLVANGDGE